MALFGTSQTESQVQTKQYRKMLSTLQNLRYRNMIYNFLLRSTHQFLCLIFYFLHLSNMIE